MRRRRTRWIALALPAAALGWLALALLLGPRRAAVAGDEGGDGAIGARACAQCHAAVYEAWRGSTHAETLREARADTLPPEIAAGGTVEHPPGRTTFVRSGEGDAARYTARTVGADGQEHDFPLTYIAGRRRMHMFVSRFEDGRLQVLPGMREEGTGPWFDYTHLIFGAPDPDPRHVPVVKPSEPTFWSGPVRAFDARCSRCHVSGRRVEVDEHTGRPHAVWRAIGVDCEACHGPGADHANHHGGMGGEDPMPSFASLTREQSMSVCLACHLEGEVVQAGLQPGDDILAHLDPTLLDDGERIDPYGRPLELVYDGLPFLASACVRLGGLTCTTCHDPHGTVHRGQLNLPPASDAMCTSCHQDVDVAEHSHHESGAPGGRCVDCHMPGLVIERGHGVVTDHSISTPRFDLPGDRVAENACVGCHRGARGAPEGAPDLARATLAARYAAWWPDAAPPPTWALVVARARESGADPEASVDALAGILYDRATPRVWRATAARLLGRFVPAGKDVALQWVDDEDDLVRREAVGALASFEGKDVDAALFAALGDASPPVRRRAARTALAGWRRVQGNRALLERVEPVLVEEARAVPDDDRRWFRLAAARDLLGDKAGALEAYETELTLDPYADAVRRYVETLRQEVQAGR